MARQLLNFLINGFFYQSWRWRLVGVRKNEVDLLCASYLDKATVLTHLPGLLLIKA